MSENAERIIVSSDKSTRKFVLLATVIAFIVSFWFIYNTFENYYAFTDEVEDQATAGISSHSERIASESATIGGDEMGFEHNDFALIGGVMFGLMGLIALIPLVALSRLRRYLAVSADGKELIIARRAGARPERIKLAEIASVESDELEFGADFGEHKAGSPAHEHDLLIHLKSGRTLAVTCPSHHHAEEAQAALQALLD